LTVSTVKAPISPSSVRPNLAANRLIATNLSLPLRRRMSAGFDMLLRHNITQLMLAYMPQKRRVIGISLLMLYSIL
jgi:hypothetical protein